VCSESAASGKERKWGKLRVEQREKVNTVPSEMDEDNRSVLVPCSSSDLERVAGTRLGTAESVMTLWASVV
jgi:hypothetical protein